MPHPSSLQVKTQRHLEVKYMVQDHCAPEGSKQSVSGVFCPLPAADPLSTLLLSLGPQRLDLDGFHACGLLIALAKGRHVGPGGRGQWDGDHFSMHWLWPPGRANTPGRPVLYSSILQDLITPHPRAASPALFPLENVSLSSLPHYSLGD